MAAKQSRSQYLSNAAAKRAAKQLQVLEGALNKLISAKTPKAQSAAFEHGLKKVEAVQAELDKIIELSAEQE